MTGVVRSRGTISVSNVLIGIIGVILFIGLALAGALFLGPRFQEATNNSKASAVSTSLVQMAQAAQMYNLSEGRSYPGSDTTELVSKGYLKSVPQGGLGYNFRTSELGGGAPGVSVVGWAADSVEGRAICTAIARQTGMTMPSSGPPQGHALPTIQTGCFQTDEQMNDVPSGVYIAYSKVK